MREFRGRTAVVTGAASGIGFAIARRLTRAGTNLVLADIDGEALDRARHDVAKLGGAALAIVTDVSDRAAIQNLAERAETAFGRIHIVVNNAGVILPAAPVERVTSRDWDWLLGVNLWGVIHGVQSFVPLLRKHGEPAHIVNTASDMGLHINGEVPTAPYSVTKYGVVALSEGLRRDLAGTNVGVSVLCPSGVNTAIWKSPRRRPARFGGPDTASDDLAVAVALAAGWAPERVADRLFDAICQDEFYVFTHTSPRRWTAHRHAQIEKAFERAAAWNAANPH